MDMNYMEAKTRIDGLVDTRNETLKKIASIAAKAIAEKARKSGGNINVKDIEELLSELTADEKFIVMAEVIAILAKNSNLKAESDRPKSNKSNGLNSIFAQRGY